MEILGGSYVLTDKDLNIYEFDNQLLETLFYVLHYLKLRILYNLLKFKEKFRTNTNTTCIV